MTIIGRITTLVKRPTLGFDVADEARLNQFGFVFWRKR